MSLSGNAVAGPSRSAEIPKSDTKTLQAYKYYPFDTDKLYQVRYNDSLHFDILTVHCLARKVSVLFLQVEH